MRIIFIFGGVHVRKIDGLELTGSGSFGLSSQERLEKKGTVPFSWGGCPLFVRPLETRRQSKDHQARQKIPHRNPRYQTRAPPTFSRFAHIFSAEKPGRHEQQP